VKALCETENNELPPLTRLSTFPSVPFDPTFNLKRSPVALVDDPGLQSTIARFPLERAVDVEVKLKPVPVVRAFAATPKPILVVTELAWKL
jgi:hypothetical protein